MEPEDAQVAHKSLFTPCLQMEPERFQTQPFQGWSVEVNPVHRTEPAHSTPTT